MLLDATLGNTYLISTYPYAWCIFLGLLLSISLIMRFVDHLMIVAFHDFTAHVGSQYFDVLNEYRLVQRTVAFRIGTVERGTGKQPPSSRLGALLYATINILIVSRLSSYQPKQTRPPL